MVKLLGLHYWMNDDFSQLRAAEADHVIPVPPPRSPASFVALCRSIGVWSFLIVRAVVIHHHDRFSGK